MQKNYISQSKKYFTNRGSITINWQGDQTPFFAEILYHTRANITQQEMRADIAGKALSAVDFIKKFIPETPWNALDEMELWENNGRLVIYK